MDVLEQFAHGDLDAFETLFRQHQGEVYGWIVRIVRDRGIAEDLTLETFWRVYRSRARFDPGRSFGAWVRRIATNAALDHLKRARPEVELLGEPPPPATPDPAIRSEVRTQVQAAFAKLPAKLRIVATLALVEQLSHQEIAEALGISNTAVRLRVFRALRLLRKTLKKSGMEP